MNIANDPTSRVAQSASNSAPQGALLDYQAPTLTQLNLGEVIAGAGGSTFDDDFQTVRPLTDGG